jgi:hypothetical protein
MVDLVKIHAVKEVVLLGAVQLRCNLAIRVEPKAEPDRHAGSLGGPEFEPDYHSLADCRPKLGPQYYGEILLCDPSSQFS